MSSAAVAFPACKPNNSRFLIGNSPIGRTGRPAGRILVAGWLLVRNGLPRPEATPRLTVQAASELLVSVPKSGERHGQPCRAAAHHVGRHVLIVVVVRLSYEKDQPFLFTSPLALCQGNE